MKALATVDFTHSPTLCELKATPEGCSFLLLTLPPLVIPSSDLSHSELRVAQKVGGMETCFIDSWYLGVSCEGTGQGPGAHTPPSPLSPWLCRAAVSPTHHKKQKAGSPLPVTTVLTQVERPSAWGGKCSLQPGTHTCPSAPRAQPHVHYQQPGSAVLGAPPKARSGWDLRIQHALEDPVGILASPFLSSQVMVPSGGPDILWGPHE